MIAAAVAVAVALTLLLTRLRRRWVLVTVTGISMTPELQPGDRLLVRRCGIAELKIGDIVVLEPPRPLTPSGVVITVRPRPATPWKVKRVAALPGDPVPPQARAASGGRRIVPDGTLIVFGDSDASRDSRHIGLYPGDRILGVATRSSGRTLRPAGHA
ncbi:MAG: hypothetical protein HOV83_19635 [Catenulispora sp.]|nr:hypothetical protein [Catenulispora sp.]